MRNILLTIVVVVLLLAAGKLHGEAYDLVADPADPLPAGRAALAAPPADSALPAGLAPGGLSPERAVGFFYQELAPHGEWISTRASGWAWYPRGVARDWRPYADGHWALSDYGWTWVTREPFGWATYHYGRGTRDPRYGWIWIPGALWGPAWVSWQAGGGYAGWAPLPPSAGFEPGRGLRLAGHGQAAGLKADAYIFVPERALLEANPGDYAVARCKVAAVFAATRNVTEYGWQDNHVVAMGLDPAEIAAAAGRPVPSLALAYTAEKARAEVKGQEMRM